MKQLSTHRLLQLAELGDKCTAMATRYRRAAKVAAEHGKNAQWHYFFGKACRLEQIAMRIKMRGIEF